MNVQGRGVTKSGNSLNTIISEFTAHKINIETLGDENDFDAVCKALRPLNVKIVVVDEHNGRVERLVHTVK